MITTLCGCRADFEHLDLGNSVLERQVALEVGRIEGRDRVRAIVTHVAAQERLATALALALETNLSVAAAFALLELLPAGTASGWWRRR
jgi:hypothetical protein